jgi:hypothetical protein
MDVDTSDHDNEIDKNCANCKFAETKNQCEQCMKHFCSSCEIKVHGESILEFFKGYKFVNYTCNTAHLSISERRNTL